MTSVLVMQGRQLNGVDIAWIRGLLDEHPEWCRSRLSRELCARWNWRNALGQPKDMAARSLLLKLVYKGTVLFYQESVGGGGLRRRRSLAVGAASVAVGDWFCQVFAEKNLHHIKNLFLTAAGQRGNRLECFVCIKGQSFYQEIPL